MNRMAQFLQRIDNLVWGPGLLLLLIGTGCYLLIRMRFLPFRNLKRALLWAFPVVGQKKGEALSSRNMREQGGISSFTSLTTELAATIGTGNIVGVATAMVLGGPGALFWMIMSSLIGMATKLVESMLSVKYRSRNDRGELVGGPMYTLSKAFPFRRMGRILAIFFAFFAVMASFGMGNMTQSNSIAEAMNAAFHIPQAATGLVVTVATILVVLGGIGVISKVTGWVVPFMGLFYLLGTLAVILTHWRAIPHAILQILAGAFCPQAVAGGALGQTAVSALTAMRWGVSRGVFSNEAGLGAAGISAAAADTEDYVRQGYISMTGVFIDTIIICTLTGLAIVSSGVLGKEDESGLLLTGTELTIAAFRTTFGQTGAYFVSISVALFAFATIVGWAYQGERAFEYLTGTSACCMVYRFLYALTAFAGAMCSLEAVWNFSDICNGLMAIPNLICVLMLSRDACLEICSYGGKKSKK